MLDSDIFAYFFLAAGLVILIASITNWDWYFKQRKAQFFVKHFGRLGARVFYAVLAVAIIIFGYMALSGNVAA